MKKTTEWLSAQNKFNSTLEGHPHIKKGPSRVISVSSGKGGVGKTLTALKFSKILSRKYRILLIDCDSNLSNTAVRLGIPITNNLHLLINGRKSFDECLYKDGNFHLLSGCNGNIELFDGKIKFDEFIVNTLSLHRKMYDYIILDCPADISTETLNLNAYSDDRFIVVVPDKASLTDSYSLIKILKKMYGVSENYLIVNKTFNVIQYQKIVKTLGDTIDRFIGGRIKILGNISLERETANDLFDSIIFDEEKSSLHHSFLKLANKYVEGVSEKGVYEL